jgi:serine/threonine-protein kinase
MPPEQLAGHALTAATDVFAVTALLFEAWSGRAPFRRESASESRRALASPVPPLSSVDERLSPLSELVARGLALDPRERPAEAEVLSRPLRDFLRSADVGDVARRLGGRVRTAAARSRPDDRTSTPPTATGAASAAQSALSSTGSLTRTFAAREEVSEWTRRLSEPAPASAPGTRKLPSDAPPASSTPGPTAEVPRTLPARRKQALAVFAAGAAIASAVLGGAQLLAARSGDAGESRAPASSAGPAPAAVPSAPASASSALPRPAIAADPSTVRNHDAPAPPALAASGPAPRVAAPAAASPVNSASLRLTADPPASVKVRGPGTNRLLRTPVPELRLAPGAYTVSFESTTFGAPVATRVVIEEGARRSVHVDFREAEPKITVR